jgi:hypothetical protein
MPRRLLAVAVAGALALAGLAACRDSPSVAAYVGSAQLTNKQVEQMVAEFPTATREKAAPQIRQLVVSNFVARELSRLLAAEHNITVPPADVTPYQQAAGNAGVNPNGAFVTLQAEADAGMRAIAQLGTPQAPTDADKREVFTALVDENIVQPGQYDQVKDQIDSPEMRAALGLRPVLQDARKKYQTSVNPRYQPVGVPVRFTLAQGQVTAQVVVSLQPSPAVSDAR